MKKMRAKNWIYGLFLGGVFVLFMIGYFEAVMALPSVVPPSSTAGLYIIVEIIAAFFAGIIGFVIGTTAAWIVDLIVSKKNSIQSAKWLKNIVCLILISGGFCFTLIMFLHAKSDQEKFNAIHKIEQRGVKYDSGIIEKVKVNKDDLRNYDLDLNKNHVIRRPGRVYSESQKDLSWKEIKYIIMFNDSNHLIIKSDAGPTFIYYSLKRYTEVSDRFISSISYLVFENNRSSYLFTLTHLLRPPSLYLLSVFSEDGTMIYEELTTRITHMEIGELNGEKVIVTGNEVSENGKRIVKIRDFIYRLKK